MSVYHFTVAFVNLHFKICIFNFSVIFAFYTLPFVFSIFAAVKAADVFVPFQFSAPDIKMGLIFIEAYYILKKFENRNKTNIFSIRPIFFSL
jgi:hypothetical protein